MRNYSFLVVFATLIVLLRHVKLDIIFNFSRNLFCYFKKQMYFCRDFLDY